MSQLPCQAPRMLRSYSHVLLQQVVQKEEVDEVRWFDIEEVHEGCLHRDGTFCVPIEGLETLMKYLDQST